MAAGIGVIRVPSPVSHVEISTATGEGGTSWVLEPSQLRSITNPSGTCSRVGV